MKDPSTSLPEEVQPRILVVDDDPLNRLILTRTLSLRGYDVVAVENGHRAIELISRHPIDLVLLDLMMPVMSGVEVLEALRETYTPITLPIIMLTSQASPAEMVRCLKSGANDYITRPMDINVTMARVEAQLNVKQEGLAQSSGKLHKLSGSEYSVPRSMNLYCHRCHTALHEEALCCHHCTTSQPTEGWPFSRTAAWSYLGQTLEGRYFLNRFIGGGSSGQVYQARDLDIDRSFAVKIVDLARFQTDQELARQQILMEIKALASLDNPHVVKIYQVLQLGAHIWAIVMDYCKGRSLLSALEEHGRLDPRVALDITRQIALALYDVHNVGLLHLDIKPGNILLDPMASGDYFVRILDFGIAQILGRPLPQTNLMLGTPDYMAPEMITGDRVLDGRIDIYSLGAVLYHMLTGTPPFTGELTQILRHHITTPPTELPQSLGPWTGRLNGMLGQMMAKAPEDRYQDISGVLSEIYDLLAA